MPKISIITICYNEDRVEDTCKSVVAQTFKDYEWIFIDGGSNEKYLEILDKYKSYMSVIISEKDSGIYNAMNKGLSFATGEFVVFMNAGDCFYNETVLEKVSKYLDKNKGDIFYGDAKFILSDNSVKYKCLPPVIDEIFLTHDCISHQSTYIRKELFDIYGGYDENYKIVSDWEKWINFLRNGAKYVQLPFTASVHRYDGISATLHDKVNKEREDVCKRYNLNTSSRYYGLPLYDLECALNPKLLTSDYEIISNNNSIEIPDFSIIVPVFNTSDYLERCLNSIFVQSHENIEVICINDASTDSSLEVLKKYQQKEPRLVIYNFTNNVGVANCRNLGIKVAKGNYIIFVDSDDYLDANFIANSYDEIKKGSYDILKGTVRLDYGKRKVSSIMNMKIQKLIEENKFIGMFWQHEFSTGVYKRSFILDNNIEFPLLTNGEDIIFILKVLIQKPQIKICNNIIYNYYQRVNSASTPREFKAALNIIAHFYEQIELIKMAGISEDEFLEYCQNNIVKRIIERWWLKDFVKNFSKTELELLRQKINQVFVQMGCFEQLIEKYPQYYYFHKIFSKKILLDKSLKQKIKDIANIDLQEKDLRLFDLVSLCKIKQSKFICTLSLFGCTIIKKERKDEQITKYYVFNIPLFKQYKKKTDRVMFYFLGIHFFTLLLKKQ